MSLFPLFLKLDGRRCVVVGAGNIADSKIHSLLDAMLMFTWLLRMQLKRSKLWFVLDWLRGISMSFYRRTSTAHFW